VSAVLCDGTAALSPAGTGAAQQHLLPALMRVYTVADTVVGLDVDRDAFDKFRCAGCPSLHLHARARLPAAVAIAYTCAWLPPSGRSSTCNAEVRTPMEIWRPSCTGVSLRLSSAAQTCSEQL